MQERIIIYTPQPPDEQISPEMMSPEVKPSAPLMSGVVDVVSPVSAVFINDLQRLSIFSLTRPLGLFCLNHTFRFHSHPLMIPL